MQPPGWAKYRPSSWSGIGTLHNNSWSPSNHQYQAGKQVNCLPLAREQSPSLETLKEPRNRLRQAGSRFLGSLQGLQIRAVGAGRATHSLLSNVVLSGFRSVFRIRGIWDGSGSSLNPYTGLRIRILLFSSVAFKMLTKNKFFCSLPVHLHQSSKKTRH